VPGSRDHTPAIHRLDPPVTKPRQGSLPSRPPATHPRTLPKGRGRSPLGSVLWILRDLLEQVEAARLVALPSSRFTQNDGCGNWAGAARVAETSRTAP
jgi:hypothetical protein